MVKPRSLTEIIAQLRFVCANQSIDTTLIQTQDLMLLCDAAERMTAAHDPNVFAAYMAGGMPNEDGSWSTVSFVDEVPPTE